MAAKSKKATRGQEAKVSIAGSTMQCTSCSLKANPEFHEPSDLAMVGSLNPTNSGRQINKKDVMGDIVLHPTYAHINTILDTFFDGASTYTPPDDASSGTGSIVVDRGDDVYTYAGVWMNSITIASEENTPVSVTLNLKGQDESNSGTVTAYTASKVMHHADGTLTIDSNTYYPRSVSFLYSNEMDDRFHFSTTRSTVIPGVRLCTLDLGFDQNSDTFADLFSKSSTTNTVDASLVYSDGTNSLTIDMDECAVLSTIPDIDGASEINSTLQLKAFLKSGNNDIVTLTYA